MKKWWVKLLLALAAAVVVVSVSVGISSVHSKSAAERYKDQLRAAGEKLDLKDLVPPRVDPNQNGRELFTQAFISMGSFAQGMLSTNTPGAMRPVAPGKAMIGWQEAEIISDYGELYTNTWADLDRDLQFQSNSIALIRLASERPQLDFELDFDKCAMLPLTHVVKMKQSALLFSSATVADLHRGNAASAATNIHTLLLTINAWKDEPLLISQLVRMAMAQIGVTAQWEFLQGTNITDQQLAMLQRDWTSMQFVPPMEKALEMERVWGTRTIEQLRTSNSPSSYASASYSLFGSGSSGGSGDWLDTFKEMGQSMKRKTSDSLWRVSWSYDDELKFLQGDQVLVETMREAQTNGFFKNALADCDRKITALGLDHPSTNWLRNHMDDELESLFGGGSVLSLKKATERALSTEVARIMAGTAVALKRYQLRHQAYPGNLNALVPDFLSEVPRDPVDGHPLRYQLLPDGAFLLYSIGSDNVDNGGDATAPASKLFYWLRARDWVWPQPATPQEIEHFRNSPPK
jgi:hypothetical protein